MIALPQTTVAGARQLLSTGWKAHDEPGRVDPPPGDQHSSVQCVSNWTWQAMAMMALEVRGEVCAGVRRPGIEPTFGAGSGWHQTGQAAPSSQQDRQGLRSAAFPATVVVLRWRGERIPATLLLQSEPPSGLLVCMDRYMAPNWYGCLFEPKMERELLPRLMHVQLERESGGVRMYGGIEVGGRGEPDGRQAWLCAPTPARAREILLAMVEQEGGPI